MLKNAYLDAKIGVDPAENEPERVMVSWPIKESKPSKADSEAHLTTQTCHLRG